MIKKTFKTHCETVYNIPFTALVSESFITEFNTNDSLFISVSGDDMQFIFKKEVIRLTDQVVKRVKFCKTFTDMFFEWDTTE